MGEVGYYSVHKVDCLALGSSRGSSGIVARGEEKYMALGGKMVNVVVESQ